MSEIYIVIFEDGTCFKAFNVTESMIENVSDGIIDVIRCSDQKQLDSNGDWNELNYWK